MTPEIIAHRGASYLAPENTLSAFRKAMEIGADGVEMDVQQTRDKKLVKIIFLTSSAEFAVESYVVGAYFYQLKPIWEDSFFRLTDSMIAECRRADQRSLILRCKTGISRIDLDQLLYCEVLGRTAGCH